MRLALLILLCAPDMATGRNNARRVGGAVRLEDVLLQVFEPRCLLRTHRAH